MNFALKITIKPGNIAFKNYWGLNEDIYRLKLQILDGYVWGFTGCTP